METENRLASLNESAPLRCHCQPGLGPCRGTLRRALGLPAPSRPNRNHGGETGVRPWAPAQGLGSPRVSDTGLGSLAAAAASPWHAGSLPLAGLRARVAPGAARDPSPPRAGRPPVPPRLPWSSDRSRHWCRCALQPWGPPPLNRACVQSRRAAVCSGAGHRGACEPVRVCGCGSVGWPRRPRTLHPGYVQ